MRPILRSAAPENAPRSEPNSSLSSSSSGRLAHGMRTKGRSRRVPHSWMRRARSSFPVPLSPKMSTLERAGATRRARSRTGRMAFERVMNPGASAAGSPAPPPERGAGAGGSAGGADLGGVTPEPLEVEENAPLGREYVHHEVQVVHEDPVAGAGALHVIGTAADGPQLLL